MKYYYGLVIGPVFKTILKARATRELWGASYLFSYLMGKVLGKFQEVEGLHILLPAPQNVSTKDSHGAGIFPDRCILRAEEDLMPDIQGSIQSAIAGLAEEMAQDLLRQGAYKGRGASLNAELHQFLKAYLQTYVVRVQEESGEIPIKRINDLMDVVELRPPFQMYEPRDQQFIQDFLYHINGSGIRRKAFAGEPEDVLSIPEISVQEFLNLKDETVRKAAEGIYKEWRAKNKAVLRKELAALKSQDREEKKKLREEKKKLEPQKLTELLYDDKVTRDYLRNYHKYIAIIYADGDNIGSTIKAMGNEAGLYKKFAEALQNFGLGAAKTIHEYGGLPVYIGGDDLLFFAPVISQDKNIFKLCTTLDDAFKQEIEKLKLEADKDPSLSFGVSISYIKFPLYEASEMARDLMYKAKGFPKQLDEDRPKNALSFTLLKHSGNFFGQTLPMVKKAKKGGRCYQIFESLLTDYLKEKENKLLSSVAYKLGRSKVLLDQIGHDATKLQHFFDENFNEDIHQQEGESYLTQVRALVHAAYLDARDYIPKLTDELKEEYSSLSKAQGTQARETIYSLLRTLQFLTQSYHV